MSCVIDARRRKPPTVGLNRFEPAALDTTEHVSQVVMLSLTGLGRNVSRELDPVEDEEGESKH
jgi:hypothetical protein